MSVHYPIMLNLEGKKVVVIGGGKVAERKINGLLGTGARVRVSSPEITEPLRNFVDQGWIDWIPKSFSEEDLHSAVLIFAATNDQKVNQSVRNSAKADQLVSIADDPDGSNFHVPAHFQRGRMTIAVSTGGASPILSSRIREQLEQEYDESYEDYLEFLFTARRRIIKEIKDPAIKRKLLSAIASPEFFVNDNREAEFAKLLSSFF